MIAHRGNMPGLTENTLPAFAAALTAGADILESDVRVTRDGTAILAHDDNLLRIVGDRRRIADMTISEVRAIDLGAGVTIPTLREALSTFPNARFNLDLKAPHSPEAAVHAIREVGAADRVLLTSFTESLRREALRLLPGVATSASARLFVRILLAHRLRLHTRMRRLTMGLCAVQIPLRAAGMSTTSRQFLGDLHSGGLEVHYWTVNDEQTMRDLIAAGADAIITDEVALARGIVDAAEPVR